MADTLPREIVSIILDLVLNDAKTIQNPWKLMINKQWMTLVADLELFKTMREFNANLRLADVEYRVYENGVQVLHFEIQKVDIGIPKIARERYLWDYDEKGLSIDYNQVLNPIKQSLFDYKGSIANLQHLTIKFGFGATLMLENDTASVARKCTDYWDERVRFLIGSSIRKKMWFHESKYASLRRLLHLNVPFRNLLVNVAL